MVLTPTPEYVIERYREKRLWRIFPKDCMFKWMGEIEGKTVLDFGGGEGEVSTQMARLGAYVSTMDISPELLEVTRKRAVLDGVADRIELLEGDIRETPLPANRFDCVFCSAVLHHVDLRAVVPLLWDTLKPGGIVVLAEPIVFSPTLQKIRDWIPVRKEASPFDKPLTRNELEFMKRQFEDHRVAFFNLFGRLERVIPSKKKGERGHAFSKAALVFLACLDRFLLTLFPFLSRFCGTLVFAGRKPTAPRQGAGR